MGVARTPACVAHLTLTLEVLVDEVRGQVARSVNVKRATTRPDRLQLWGKSSPGEPHPLPPSPRLAPVYFPPCGCRLTNVVRVTPRVTEKYMLTNQERSRSDSRESTAARQLAHTSGRARRRQSS